MDKIITDRSTNIEWFAWENDSLFVKFKSTTGFYEYKNFRHVEFFEMKSNFIDNNNYSIGSYISINVVKRYGKNFIKH